MKLTNEFAAYHEAGHATATRILGGDVVSMGIKPTPHCIPDVQDLSDHCIATICMAGCAATFIKYGSMGAFSTDYAAAAQYGDPAMALARAITLLTKNSVMMKGVAEDLLIQIPYEDRHKEVKICVDTVDRVRQDGCHTTVEDALIEASPDPI